MIKDNGIKDSTSLESVIKVSVQGGVAKPRPLTDSVKSPKN